MEYGAAETGKSALSDWYTIYNRVFDAAASCYTNGASGRERAEQVADAVWAALVPADVYKLMSVRRTAEADIKVPTCARCKQEILMKHGLLGYFMPDQNQSNGEQSK